MASNTTDNRQGQGTLRDAGKGIDAPRLTPQGRTDPDAAGEDDTSPKGGSEQGQPSKAEG
ncbi:hypothetical protein [Enterovirga aerilata]|uniref:Uncharacterized protein n=1 Tax=Enterovirga aerilata TaxID=2730920 RepID=A0A849I4L3_9HYPH|nr:hypothetical protein [Enterovirga sp. DB1703]NNM71265.1 hypothetical protein [Enterovirga sp. DB1703]